MLIVITYDVNTIDTEGKRRLRRVSKVCVNYGQRVQNSVFECVVDTAQYLLIKQSLLGIIDKNKDSLRIYQIGSHYQGRIEHFGIKTTYDPDDVLLL